MRKRNLMILTLLVVGALAGCQEKTEETKAQSGESKGLVDIVEVEENDDAETKLLVEPITPKETEEEPQEQEEEQEQEIESGKTEFPWTVYDEDEIDGTVYTDVVEVSGYTGEETKIEIPEEIEGKTVRRIYQKSFLGSSVTEAVIPDTLVYIGSSAFQNCKELKKIDLGQSVRHIGEMAFYEASALEEITIPDSVTDLGIFTFGNCVSLKKAELGKGLSKITAGTFSGCSALETVVIPSSVEVIADNAFENVNKKLVIYGEAGSKAEELAKEQGFSFKVQ